jgi:hypothetical protein
MPKTILPAFLTFHNEAAIIGRLLAGYAELEIGLMNCVSQIHDDLDMVLKTMFRTRGESQRVAVADALGRHYYAQHGLDTEFSMAIGAIGHCLKIRNQYAHCNWYDDHSGRLAFVNLEEGAKPNGYVKDLLDLTISHVDVPFLQEQEDYFAFADELTAWVNYEGRHRAGKLANQPLAKPRQRTPPPLRLP